MENSDTLSILRKLELGQIDARQAEEQMHASIHPPEPEGARDEEPRPPAWARRYWLYPLTGGMVIVALGAWIIVATVGASILWLLVGLPIVLLGSLIVAAAASMPTAHWLLVSIQSARGRHNSFRFGIPFPIGLLRFALWIAIHVTSRPGAGSRIYRSDSRFGWSWGDFHAFLASLERELDGRRELLVDIDDGSQRVQVYWL